MSNIESPDEPPGDSVPEQAAKCKKCDKPAIAHGRFCKDHQMQANTRQTKGWSPRLDIVLGVVLIVAICIWVYPRLTVAPSDTAGSAKRSDANKKPDAADKPIAAPAPGKVEPKPESRPVIPAAVGADRSASAAPGACGNGVIDLGEQCDGQALGGASCVSLGFSGDCGPEEGCIHPGLTCLGSCRFDYSGCTAENQAALQRFIDQGNGTAADRLTGLTWELKCSEADCSAKHDVLATFPWAGAATQWVSSLNEERFAGHNDWRLPSLEELRSLLVAVPPCPTEPCAGSAWPRKLTATAGYWSSTTFSVDKHRAWAVSFRDGDVYTAEKGEALHVRAVRSGS